MPHTAPTRFQETRYLVLDARIIDKIIAAKLTLGEVTKHPWIFFLLCKHSAQKRVFNDQGHHALFKWV